ncbi:MAG: tetratricopeptide repeat protein [Nitrospirae bacterium]|nr:tetratricopeptide repeat protein [Nitrospirota bacterium]
MAKLVSVLSALMFVLLVASAGHAGKCEVNQPRYVPPADETAKKADAAYAKGLRAMMEKRLDDAVAGFEESLKLDPRAYNTRLTLANVYRIQKNDGEAERVFRQAIEAEPKFPAAYEALMVLLTDHGRGKDAASVGDAALAGGIPEKSLPTLGWSYYLAGEKEKAGACFGRNIEYRPGDYYANRDMGAYLLEGGDAAGALKHFDLAEKALPGQAVTSYLKAAAYRALGDEVMVFEHVREMIRRDDGFKFNTDKYARQNLPHSKPPDLSKYLFNLSDEFLKKRGGQDTGQVESQAQGEPGGTGGESVTPAEPEVK